MFKFQNYKSGKFIAVSGGSTLQGAGVILYNDEGQADIKWQVTKNLTDGLIKLKNSRSNLFAAVEGGSSSNGANIIQWADQGQRDIKWIFELSASTGSGAAPGLTRIRKNQWQLAMNLVLATMKLRINNYTPTAFEFERNNTFKYYKPNDSRLKIGFSPSVIEQTFLVYPDRNEPVTMYYTDINSRSASIEPAGRELKLTVNFEQTGNEVLGNCIDNIICGGGMWWINLEGIKVDVYINPVVEDGKISYSSVRAIVTGVAKSDGMNIIVENLNNNVIFNKASQRISEMLNRPEIKTAFVNGLNSNLSRLSTVIPNPLRRIDVDPVTGDLLLQ